MHRLLQLTLDLFDAAVPAPEPVKQAPSRPPRARPAPPLKPDLARTGHLDSVLVPASFRHPRANREAVLGDSVVAYEFRRARRRTIGFMVGAEGLTVSAPKWVPLHEVDSAVQTKSSWILRKLGDAHDRHQRTESARIDWRDGAVFPYLGEQVVVVLDPAHAFKEVGAVLKDAAERVPGQPHHSLHLGLPHAATAPQIRDAVQAWLMRQATTLFTQRLEHFAPQLGVRWRKLALSNAGTRWGTAHSDGVIRLNWRLIHFRLPVIDYVVAHELSHLRVMDHSPRFWQTVSTVVPDYPQLRAQLKGEALPPW
ncbi:SprT family zinc-dependent metalloprotease [Ramlibacter sp.]|uniref:M48 family metallopeptidase n=1 Tax=Ramlibacter sp. TaxID=1917967 RepID=UPI002BEAC073|nr:SprT family zinc-dependent metalloprotease [Ramlibacter sp.]HWI80883.1 SprT family zinc-dependent metalloprotease [Ramlibacter sp.]